MRARLISCPPPKTLSLEVVVIVNKLRKKLTTTRSFQINPDEPPSIEKVYARAQMKLHIDSMLTVFLNDMEDSLLSFKCAVVANVKFLISEKEKGGRKN